MLRKKNLYCFDCGRTTPHSYVGKKSMFEGVGPARIIMAVASLGITETSLADKYWQCEACGNIKKHS